MVTSNVQVWLLGDFRLQVDEQPLTLALAPRAQSLLAYLLLKPQSSHSRQHLAFLLWPDTNERQARTNLRNLLFQLRQSWPTIDQYLQISAVTLQWEPRIALTVDVSRFEAALALAEQSVANEEQQLAAYQQALAWYGGDLLPAHYDEWILNGRERLRARYLGLLQQLSEVHGKRGHYGQAIQITERLVQADPLREESYRRLMQFHIENHDHAQALRTFYTCATTLQQELDVDPSPLTVAIYQQIFQRQRLLDATTTTNLTQPTTPTGKQAVTPSTVTPAFAGNQPHTQPTTSASQIYPLPTSTTPFVGRHAEIQQLITQLVDPDRRLITLIGVGGIGKTRLALETAGRLREQATPFRDGICYCPLISLTDPEQIIVAIAQACGVPLQPTIDPVQQVAAYLQLRRLLLILDNFEHLLNGVAVVADLLAKAPTVTFLVTSRVALNLRAESRLLLTGLTHPTATIALDETASAWAALAPYSAVTLFVQAAQRAQPDFQVTAANVAEITRICQLVSGAPLALEMAAAWVRLYDCRTIAQRIATGLELLVATTHDTPERHRSMAVVLEQTWQLLHGSEQRLLAQLSVFAGGFPAPAVQAVTGAGPLALAQLLDKALLYRSENRFDLHPLMHRFAQEQLARLDRNEHLVAATRTRHGVFFLTLLEEQRAAILGQAPQQAQATLAAEFANIQAAWQWATEVGAAERLAPCLTVIMHYFELAGLYETGAAIFTKTIQHFTGVDAQSAAVKSAQSMIQSHLLNQLQLCQAELYSRLGRYAEAVQAIHTLHTDTVGRLELRQQAQADLLLGWLAHQRGKREEARSFYEQAYARVAALTDATQAARLTTPTGAEPAVYNNRDDILLLAKASDALATVLYHAADHDRRLQLHQTACRLAQQQGNRWAQAYYLSNTGLFFYDSWHFEAALDFYRQAEAIYQQLGSQYGLAINRSRIGWVYVRLQQYEAALACFQQTSARLDTIGITDVTDAWQGMGSTYLALGEWMNALLYIEKAMQLSIQLGRKSNVADSLLVLAPILVQTGEYVMARRRYQEALALYQELGVTDGIALCHVHIGVVEQRLKRLNEAVIHLDQALMLLANLRNNPYLPYTLLVRAEIAFDLADDMAATTFCQQCEQTIAAYPPDQQIWSDADTKFRLQLLQAKLLYRRGQTSTAIQQLDHLRQREQTLSHQAQLYFTLWQLTSAAEHGQAALQRYTQLYAQRTSQLYRERLHLLQNALGHSHATVTT